MAGWKRAILAGGGLALALVESSSEAYASAGCQALNTIFTSTYRSITGAGFTAGDVVTITITGSIGNTAARVVDLTTGNLVYSAPTGHANNTYTFPTSTDQFQVDISLGSPGTAATVSCVSVAGSSTGTTTSTPANQLVNNAQTGVVYGQQTLQNYNDWVSKGVIASFNFGLSGGTAAAKLRELTARDKVAKAADNVRDLNNQLAALHAQPSALDDERAKDIQAQLATAQRDLIFARRNAEIAAEGGVTRVASADAYTIDGVSPEEVAALRANQPKGLPMPTDNSAVASTLVYDGPIGSAQQAPSPAPPIHFNARDLAAYCDSDCDVLGNKWNVWGEGRIIGATDSLAQTNAFGFVGSIGGDYKLQPWLALGLSVGVESFRTNFSSNSANSSSLGVSAVPYVGFRLSDNIALTVMAGLSSITYNNNPISGVTAQFQALRYLVGGALTGVWRDGPWRFQPSLSGTYGSENQYGYTDSSGNVVPGQMISYGRLSAGPEIGYTIESGQSSVRIEPFVTAKGSVDFASNTVGLFNGTPLVVRSGPLGSGSTGVGLALQFDNGFYARGQLSYDSIGVQGLDIWSTLLRGGFTF